MQQNLSWLQLTPRNSFGLVTRYKHLAKPLFPEITIYLYLKGKIHGLYYCADSRENLNIIYCECFGGMNKET